VCVCVCVCATLPHRCPTYPSPTHTPHPPDINACQSYGCGANAVCVDKPPPALNNADGRTCVCKEGYGGNPTSSCSGAQVLVVSVLVRIPHTHPRQTSTRAPLRPARTRAQAARTCHPPREGARRGASASVPTATSTTATTCAWVRLCHLWPVASAHPHPSPPQRALWATSASGALWPRATGRRSTRTARGPRRARPWRARVPRPSTRRRGPLRHPTACAAHSRFATNRLSTSRSRPRRRRTGCVRPQGCATPRSTRGRSWQARTASASAAPRRQTACWARS